MAELFMAHFLTRTLVISGLILIVLLCKKVLRKHISARWQYNLGFLVLGLLLLPLIPNEWIWKAFSFLKPFDFNFGLGFGLALSKGVNAKSSQVDLMGNWMTSYGDWFQDFTLTVNRSSPLLLNRVLLLLWLAGVLIYWMFFVTALLNIRRIKHSVVPFSHETLRAVCKQCLKDLKMNKDIVFGESERIKTPMTVGLFKPYVILPRSSTEQLSQKEIYYIVLHELIHYQHRDILINYILSFLQAFYWFNPVVFCAFREMRGDRELACDTEVLSFISKAAYKDYGLTIIRFAEMLSPTVMIPIGVGMGSAKKQIRKRIEKIAAFQGESRRLKVKSLCIFILLGLLLCSQSFVLWAGTSEGALFDFYGVNKDKVEFEDLSEYFDGYDGSFVLYDVEKDQYQIYNKEQSVTRVSPNSTYKIYSALIALDQAVISPEQSQQSWDGTEYPFVQWNADQDLASALQFSVNWYFQNLDQAVGVQKLRDYFRRMNYGNANLSGGPSDFWAESSLRISPVEQVLLLKKLIMNNSLFKKEHVDLVKGAIKLSQKDGTVLYGKTGSGSVNGLGISGWFIGCVEREGNIVLFATNLQGQKNVSGSFAADITHSILRRKELIK